MSPTEICVNPLAVPTRCGTVTVLMPFQPHCQSSPFMIAAALAWPALNADTLFKLAIGCSVLLLTGFSMMGEMARVPAYVQAMTGVGILMMAIFLHVYFAPFGRLKRAVAAEDWKAGGAALAQVRVLVGVNLLLGIFNVALAVLGVGLH